MLRAVQVRPKAHTLVGDFTQFGQAKDLVAARVGEHGSRPGHESMQPTELPNQLVPWAKIKVIGIGEDDFRAKLLESFLAQRLDRALRAHRHERRCLDGAMRSLQNATTRTALIRFNDAKRKIHPGSVSQSPLNRGPSHL